MCLVVSTPTFNLLYLMQTIAFEPRHGLSTFRKKSELNFLNEGGDYCSALLHFFAVMVPTSHTYKKSGVIPNVLLLSEMCEMAVCFSHLSGHSHTSLLLQTEELLKWVINPRLFPKLDFRF